MVLKCAITLQTRDADKDVVILCQKGVCASFYEHFHASLPASKCSFSFRVRGGCP